MNWAAIGALGGIVGTGAVVASLIYLLRRCVRPIRWLVHPPTRP